MRCIGLFSAPPELLSESTRGALERRLTSLVTRKLGWTATELSGAIRSAHPGIDDEQLRAVMSAARDDEQEVDP